MPKVIVVLPAFNAEKTLVATLSEIDFSVVDEVVLVDDCSSDNTVEVAKSLGIKTIIEHKINTGYGGAQKTCYKKALELGGEIIIMLHPDYQYAPKLINAFVAIISSQVYPVVFASRILGNGAIRGGMPLYKYIANRALTLFQNVLMNQKLSEYHTGYRAYSREVLEKINYESNSDGFVFDNEIIAQVFACGYEIAEITCPTKYAADSSSISFRKSVQYGFGVLRVSMRYYFHRIGLFRWDKLSSSENR